MEGKESQSPEEIAITPDNPPKAVGSVKCSLVPYPNYISDGGPSVQTADKLGRFTVAVQITDSRTNEIAIRGKDLGENRFSALTRGTVKITFKGVEISTMPFVFDREKRFWINYSLPGDLKIGYGEKLGFNFEVFQNENSGAVGEIADSVQKGASDASKHFPW